MAVKKMQNSDWLHADNETRIPRQIEHLSKYH